ncbi:MAG: cytochrome c family protein, partial [Hyphomicrobiales bacterium]|nr:cytochrome c family protein [Hyphomicrobiales bacterium]
GRKSGTVAGYSYSEANKNSGITWDEATFKDYIKDPKAKIPGTKMAFAGIKKETEVNDLWAFLAQYGADGKIK